MIIKVFARALECIPRSLTRNAGFDATDVLNQLRQRHAASQGIQRHTKQHLHPLAAAAAAAVGADSGAAAVDAAAVDADSVASGAAVAAVSVTCVAAAVASAAAAALLQQH